MTIKKYVTELFSQMFAAAKYNIQKCLTGRSITVFKQVGLRQVTKVLVNEWVGRENIS